MNPTFDHKELLHKAERTGSWHSVRMLAESDARAAPPAPGEPYAGERTIANAYKPLRGSHPYFAKETAVSGAMTLALGAASVALPFVFEPSLPLIAVLAFTVTGTVISGYYWIFKKWGPGKIAEERLVNANGALKESGDDHAKPVGLLETLVLTGIMTIDGFLSGSSLVDSVFAHLFTPRMALIAAVAWGVGATVLLYKLIQGAAMEAAINERRAIIRNLSVSPDAADQTKAMKEAVGGKLGRDYSTKANRWFARVALGVAVMVLAGSTFLLRANAGNDETAAQPQAPGTHAPAALHPAGVRVRDTRTTSS